jgi:hypothetical protein
MTNRACTYKPREEVLGDTKNRLLKSVQVIKLPNPQTEDDDKNLRFITQMLEMQYTEKLYCALNSTFTVHSN